MSDRNRNPGVNAKWLRRKPNWHTGHLAEWCELNRPFALHRLDHYARFGLVPGYSCSQYYASGTYMKWTHYLREELATYAQIKQFEFAAEATANRRFDAATAMHAFAAHHLRDMIGFKTDACDIYDLHFAVLGIIVGCDQPAFLDIRMRLGYFREALQQECFAYLRDRYPIIHLMCRLLTDYLDEAPLLSAGSALEQPACRALAMAWRQDDAESLVPLCRAVCDFHTQQHTGPGYEFTEWWHYVPTEILLLFKLRQRLGLANPTLEHPLLDGAFGALPPEIAFAPDPLIGRVRERMMEEGYREPQLPAPAAPPSTPDEPARASRQRAFHPAVCLN